MNIKSGHTSWMEYQNNGSWWSRHIKYGAGADWYAMIFYALSAWLSVVMLKSYFAYYVALNWDAVMGGVGSANMYFKLAFAVMAFLMVALTFLFFMVAFAVVMLIHVSQDKGMLMPINAYTIKFVLLLAKWSSLEVCTPYYLAGLYQSLENCPKNLRPTHSVETLDLFYDYTLSDNGRKFKTYMELYVYRYILTK